jgi:pumilio RNA-binding family
MIDAHMMMTQSEENLKNQPFKDLVFHEVIPHLHSLITDVFGNYVIQKLLEFGSAQMRATIADQILGYMLKLTKNKYGCRVI